MRVLHLLSSSGYHGAENMLAELIRQLSILGVSNYIGVFYGQKGSNCDIFKTVESHTTGAVIFPCNGKVDLRPIWLLRRYVKQNNIDIIHSHKYKTNLFALLSTIGTETRLVSTCHNWIGSSFKMSLYAKIDKNILRAYDAVVGVSDEVASELKNYVKNVKVKKIANGIDTGRFCRQIDKDSAKKELGLDGKKVIGFVGRLSPGKGVTYLLDAVSALVKTDKSVCVMIVGSGGYQETLADYASSLGISDHVIFTGNRTDTPLIYAALDVFVLPSFKEAFPMVILEAMACGVPIVATRVGDIPRIIKDNCGTMVEPKDAFALTRAIGELLSNGEMAKRFAETAYKEAQNYSSTAMAKNYIRVYEEVLQKNNG